MLRNFSDLKGFDLLAADGAIGRCDDFLFDEHGGTIRYLVAATAKWLPGRKVVIAPAFLDRFDWAQRLIPLRLTREQVENSPPLGQHQPVSTPSPRDLEAGTDQSDRLHSADELIGYRIEASDGDTGRVHDLLVDDSCWEIRYLVVTTGGWLSDRKLLLSMDRVDLVQCAQRSIAVNLPRDAIENSPEYDPARPWSGPRETDLYLYFEHPRHAPASSNVRDHC